jgi:hypothetical protein
MELQLIELGSIQDSEALSKNELDALAKERSYADWLDLLDILEPVPELLSQEVCVGSTNDLERVSDREIVNEYLKTFTKGS